MISFFKGELFSYGAGLMFHFTQEEYHFVMLSVRTYTWL